MYLVTCWTHEAALNKDSAYLSTSLLFNNPPLISWQTLFWSPYSFVQDTYILCFSSCVISLFNIVVFPEPSVPSKVIKKPLFIFVPKSEAKRS